MHPIERLRYVARSDGAPADVLVRESATALGAYRGDPAGMLTACRRMLDRQLTCAPLWWLCARMLCSPDPVAEGDAAVDQLSSDTTGSNLAAALGDDWTVVVPGWPGQTHTAFRRRGDLAVVLVDVAGEARHAAEQLEQLDVDVRAVPARSVAAAVHKADVVLVESFAVGPEAALVPAGSRAAASVARIADTPVWIVAGEGRLMPGPMFDALTSHWEERNDPLRAEEEVISLDLVDRFAGVDGVSDVADGLLRMSCPVAPELFSLAG